MRLNRGVVPPNNFHYPVEKGVILRAATLDLLVKEIETWRTQNGIPVGNPEKDIDDYVCSKWPHYCQVSSNEEVLVQANTDMLKQVNGWAAITMRSTPKGGYDLVDNNVAKERAAKCLECPFNRNWRGSCGTCMSATDTILIRIRQLRKIPLDESLLGCSINGFDCKTAIHLPDAAFKMTDTKKQNLPQNCWLKQSTT
jgi:hypothetical protein